MPLPVDDHSRRALILDFDGVLVDSEALNFRAWDQAFAEQKALRVSGGYQQIVGLSLAQLYDHWPLRNGHDPAALSALDRQALLARKNELFFSWATDQLQIMPGSVDLVARARSAGWYVALASRARRLRLLRTLELIRFPLPFDVIMGSEDSVDALTDRKVHSRAGAVFGIDSSACVVIEDSRSGVADACAAAIGHVIGLTSSADASTLREAGAHEVVTALVNVVLR